MYDQFNSHFQGFMRLAVACQRVWNIFLLAGCSS